MDVYSGLGSTSAFYARVVKALRMYGITFIYPDSGFYGEVVKELSASDSGMEIAVKRVLRKTWMNLHIAHFKVNLTLSRFHYT